MSLYPRDRITRALQLSADQGIAVVAAPAGYGKTEAVADAFPAACWVRVPSGTVSVESFARALVDAAFPKRRRGLDSLLTGEETATSETALGEWVAEQMQHAVSRTVIIEDVHLLDVATQHFLGKLIEGSVGKIVWIIIGRTLPAWGLATWISRGWMNYPIELGDLCFTVAETRDLAAAIGADVSELSLDSLVRELGGWPFGLRLALVGWKEKGELPHLRARMQDLLGRYLDTFVWEPLGADERNVLLYSALMDDITPDVLEAVGCLKAGAILKRLLERLPMMTASKQSYRAHDMLRDYLFAKLEDAGEVQERSGQLAAAYDRLGRVDLALIAIERSGEPAGIADFLDRRGIELVDKGHAASVARLLSGLAVELQSLLPLKSLRALTQLTAGQRVDDNVILALVRSDTDTHRQVALLYTFLRVRGSGREPVPIAALDLVGEVLQRPDIDDAGKFVLAARSAVVAQSQGVPEMRDAMLQVTQQARETLSPEERLVGDSSLALVWCWMNRYDRGSEIAEEALPLSESLGYDYITLSLLSVLTSAANERDDLEAAQQSVRLMFSLARRSKDIMDQRYFLRYILGVSAVMGVQELVDACLAWGKELNVDFFGRLPGLALWQLVTAHIAFGRKAEALQVLDRFPILSSSDEALVSGYRALLLAASDPMKARSYLTVPKEPIVVWITDTASQARMVQAVAHWLLGRPARAREIAAELRASKPASEVGHRRGSTFAYDLVQTNIELYTPALLEAQLANMPRFNVAGASFWREVIVLPTSTKLSPMELEIVREFKRGGTADEVAARLARSPNTVNTHMKAAAKKLGVSGRQAVIAKVESNGWL